MRAAVLTMAVLAGAGPAWGEDPSSLLTQGKLDADLGNREAAAKAFAAVADADDAPAALRWEALVRLGLVRRDAGDADGAVKAYERVWAEYGKDKEALRFLVQAIAGAVPGGDRWEAIWQKVAVKRDGAEADHPILRVAWPGVPSRSRTYTGQRITLELREGPLNDVFRLFADVTQLNVVVHPGIRGTITIQAKDRPWDEVLDLILAPHGLVASHVGNVLEIGPAARVGSSPRFKGEATDVDFKDLDLHEAFRRLAERGGREVSIDSSVAGRVTIVLKGVPWDQAFDLLARVNGLAWKQDGTSIRVGREEGSR